MKKLLTIIPLMVLVGCASKPIMSPTQMANLVGEGTAVGLSFYPQAMPEVRIAQVVICAEASLTNVNPATIVYDLSQAGVTNVTTKLIVDGGLLLYSSILSSVGTNGAAQPYLS